MGEGKKTDEGDDEDNEELEEEEEEEIGEDDYAQVCEPLTQVSMHLEDAHLIWRPFVVIAIACVAEFWV